LAALAAPRRAEAANGLGTPGTPKSLPVAPEEADDDGTRAGAQLLHWKKTIHDASEARVALSASGVADRLQSKVGSTESGDVVWGGEQRLDDYLRGRLTRALAELAGIDPDVILSENVDVVVAVLLEKHMPTEIRIDWDGATRTPVTEVTTQVRDQFDRDEIYTVPPSKVVVSIPISGTTESSSPSARFGMGPRVLATRSTNC
jgi:hypothetical protein